MSSFKTWITMKLGYLPRQIDLANELGHARGELVRKWMNGLAYPDKFSAAKLAAFLDMSLYDVQKEILKMRIDDLES